MGTAGGGDSAGGGGEPDRGRSARPRPCPGGGSGGAGRSGASPGRADAGSRQPRAGAGPPPPPPPAALSRRAMEQPRRITDSFQRRRRPGRPPGRVKVKGCPRARPPAAPPAEDPPAAPPDQALLEMLRRFDLAWEYGPCTGITRLQRWERAQALGLSPPGPVRDALLEHQDNPDVTYSLWHEYAL
ncbi:DNA polymerase delta subunit 4 [Falco biarmicus]|uniref:DNA polymerase delta subunit 4 n=1 Tax=Falco rusticolus TaxID=120794 RepID=UPI0018866350|nr:DNA polymerase delta subunit 4 [Falco rusticolus]XP_056210592.1 DNA polymerase delta subunit 4 [Falco biarmicus]